MPVLRARQEVVFNPANPDHRAAYLRFLTERSWKNGPKFEFDSRYTNIPEMCRDKLLKHYMSGEFGGFTIPDEFHMSEAEFTKLAA